MAAETFIAIDWGTSSRRSHRVEGGVPIASERDERGAAGLVADDYPAEVAAIRGRLGDLPVMIAGMAGSNIGWRQVPYVEAPATLDDLAGALEWTDERTAIVPGLCCREAGRVDVMRGEEVQLLGAAAAGLVPPDALLCQPGTHSKWAGLEGGAITAFVTAMTGELFALLSRQGLLARQLTGTVAPGAEFERGVLEGARCDLAASLFGVRARGLLGQLNGKDAPSYASGILIGADVTARIDSGREVHIVSDPQLGHLYEIAVRLLGGKPYRVDSQLAFVAGISRIWELAS
jgi:2-dehydro-3-deoxygalactonokinase